MTQLDNASNNEITKEMEIVAEKENINVKELIKKIADGKVVIPASKLHKNLNPIGILLKHINLSTNFNHRQ